MPLARHIRRGDPVLVLAGAAPFAIVGETAPAPVTYSVMVLPRWAVVMELKIAGPVALTFKIAQFRVQLIQKFTYVLRLGGQAFTRSISNLAIEAETLRNVDAR